MVRLGFGFLIGWLTTVRLGFAFFLGDVYYALYSSGQKYITIRLPFVRFLGADVHHDMIQLRTSLWAEI
jgi:hypothetical protein